MTSPAQADMKPLEWIIGKWVSFEAIGRYPTIKDFTFNDTLQFESVRPNVINFREDSKTIDTGNLFYSERGFLTIKPGTNDVALVVAQIIGTTSVEEGKIENQKITFQSKCIGRSLYFKPSLSNVVKDVRKYWLEGDILNYSHDMETENTPMTNHIIVKYRKA